MKPFRWTMIDISTLVGMILLGASFDMVKGEPNIQEEVGKQPIPYGSLDLSNRQ